jgi:hypothetical protein
MVKIPAAIVSRRNRRFCVCTKKTKKTTASKMPVVQSQNGFSVIQVIGHFPKLNSAKVHGCDVLLGSEQKPGERTKTWAANKAGQQSILASRCLTV